jgi:hypothetical protein
MTTTPLFPGFDGLMTLSRREGIDIRPTLLRVLTDLYVQASKHSTDEERQFVELTSRLIDQVDDATRAVVRGRLAIYPNAPTETLRKLGLKPANPEHSVPLAREIPSPPVVPAQPSPLSEAQLRMQTTLSMLACAARALDMPSAVFQRVLLFLNPEIGTSVHHVYRLSRLYDRLSERSALIMLAAWRGSTMAVTRAKYRPTLHDDERQRARVTPAQTRPTVQPGSAPLVRTGKQGSGR